MEIRVKASNSNLFAQFSNNDINKIGMATCVALLIFGVPLECRAEDKPAPVSAKIEVHACAETVIDAIHHLRQDEPLGVKMLSHSGHESTIEETFEGLPIVGRAKCVYKEEYSPHRVDFHMVESDKLKAFDGWWKLTPISTDITEVELATGVDTGLRVPFARQITNASTLRSIHKQLEDMKRSAESRQQASLKSSM